MQTCLCTPTACLQVQLPLPRPQMPWRDRRRVRLQGTESSDNRRKCSRASTDIAHLMVIKHKLFCNVQPLVDAAEGGAPALLHTLRLKTLCSSVCKYVTLTHQPVMTGIQCCHMLVNYVSSVLPLRAHQSCKSIQGCHTLTFHASPLPPHLLWWYAVEARQRGRNGGHKARRCHLLGLRARLQCAAVLSVSNECNVARLQAQAGQVARHWLPTTTTPAPPEHPHTLPAESACAKTPQYARWQRWPAPAGTTGNCHEGLARHLLERLPGLVHRAQCLELVGAAASRKHLVLAYPNPSLPAAQTRAGSPNASAPAPVRGQ